jgi:hypothetical protein
MRSTLHIQVDRFDHGRDHHALHRLPDPDVPFRLADLESLTNLLQADPMLI